MRRILCPACAAKWPAKQDPEDEANGFKMRRVEIPHCKKPPGLHIEVNGVAQPELKEMLCDACCVPLLEGTPVVAISRYRGELGPWEKEYGL